MRYPWVNSALLVVLAAQTLSGFGGLISGADDRWWILWLHGAGGFALLVLFRWKVPVILTSFRRQPRFDLSRLGSVLLAVLVLAALGTGFVWSVAGAYQVGAFSLLTVHVVIGLALPSVLIWHVVTRRFIFRVAAAVDRRAFLRFGGAMVAGIALGEVATRASRTLPLPGSKRRFTGSYEVGSYSGEFPFVSWLFDDPPPVSVTHWRLTITGAVERPVMLTYAQLAELAGPSPDGDRITALIDCTGGWYSVQEWRGVLVTRLLDLAGVKADARSVTFEAVSGYARRFPVDEARRFLLATHVAGRPLDHGHGFPARLAAPGRRGFDWVKWVARIEVNETSALLQPPVPLQ